MYITTFEAGKVEVIFFFVEWAISGPESTELRF
jgi:hypothetical protein